MKETTLCYIKENDKVLMLYRNRKEQDMNQGKWIGVGGKLEPGESPEECLIREVYEETGLRLTSYKFCGRVNFILDAWEDEITYLYLADGYEGRLTVADGRTDRFLCPEGELAWIEKDRIMDLNLWEGDRQFLEALIEGESIDLTLHYDRSDKLVEVIREKDSREVRQMKK